MTVKTIKLKVWKPFFDDILKGYKPFEVRKNTKDYQVGDVLELYEYDQESYTFTGRFCKVVIIYVLKGGKFGVAPGYCVMGIRMLEGGNARSCGNCELNSPGRCSMKMLACEDWQPEK